MRQKKTCDIHCTRPVIKINTALGTRLNKIYIYFRPFNAGLKIYGCTNRIEIPIASTEGKLLSRPQLIYLQNQYIQIA
jgi:hypothetical protein